MTAIMDINTLTSIIRDYDASFNVEAVQTAVDRDNSGILAEWAAVHLTADTLLTAEELQQ